MKKKTIAYSRKEIKKLHGKTIRAFFYVWHNSYTPPMDVTIVRSDYRAYLPIKIECKDVELGQYGFYCKNEGGVPYKWVRELYRIPKIQIEVKK